MSDERIDTIDKFYKPGVILQAIEQPLFWSSVIFSFLNLFTSLISKNVIDVITIVYVVLVITHFSISFINEYIIFPKAEYERRKQLLANSLNVLITLETTRKYYNNDYEPSITKLGANVFENSLFGKEISKRMLITETIKMTIYFLLWFAIILIRKTELQTILIITQTLFSSEILLQWLRLIILNWEMKKVFNALFNLFTSMDNNTTNSDICAILNEFASYESVKLLTRIQQSTKIFFKINPKLSLDWEQIRKKVGMK